MLSRRGTCFISSRSCVREVSSTFHRSWQSLYEIAGEPIGRGYAGKVYKITAKNMDRLDPLISDKSQLSTIACPKNTSVKHGEYLACKVIRRFRGGKDTIKKITSEVQAMVSLQRDLGTYMNPVQNSSSKKSYRICNVNIPPKSASPILFAVYEDSMEVAIVMEYAHGGSLYDLCGSAYPYNFTASLSSDSSNLNSSILDSCAIIPQFELDSCDGLPETYIRQLLTSVLEALVYMHDTLKMVHLDVKAENLLLRQPYPSADVFFTDFGLATILTEGKQHRELAGTPDYVAPEIINYDPITFATDMWSVGVLTYYLLTGVSPFLSDDKYITMQNITHGTITYPDTLFKHRSSNSIDFIQRLLQRSPTQRMSAKECLSHPWLQPTNQPIIVGPKITYQSQSTLQNNTNHINDKLNYAIELFHVDPIIEMVGECLSCMPLTYFTTQSPVYMFSYVNTVYQTNIVKIISLASYNNYLSPVKPISTHFTQSSIATTNNHSLTEQSFGKTFKTLFTGHFNALNILFTLSRIYVTNWNSSGEDNDVDNNNNIDSYHLMSKHSIDETIKHEGSFDWLTNNSSSLMDYLCNSTAVKYDRFKDFKTSDNFISVSTFLSKYVQEYQLTAMFHDLNYHKLLHCNYYYLNRNNATNIFGSSIISNTSFANCFLLSNKIQQQQKFNEEKINRSLIDKDCEEMKEDLVKVSKYTTDILVPRMNEFLSKTVNPYISTICIDLNSSISSEKHKILNPSENKYKQNYTRDYLSYDFSCVKYHTINNNAWCSFKSPIIISSSILFSLRGQYSHRRYHFQHLNCRKKSKFSISNQTTTSTNIIKFNKDNSLHHHCRHHHHHEQQQQQQPTKTSFMETSYSSSSNSQFRHIITFSHLPYISLLLLLLLQRTQTISLRLFTTLFYWFQLFLRNILHLLFFLLPSLFGK